MKKKLFTVLFIALAVVALACAFAACSSSDDRGDPDDLTYMKQGDEYVVTGIGGYDGSNLVIPAEHNGLPVTSIDDYAFFNCKTITAVTIPDTVTYIGDYAFYYCKYIKSVNIPKDVLYIGSYAFYKCTGLENVYYDAVNPRSTYSSSFEYIGEDTFNSTVTVGKNVTRIPSSMFYYSRITDVVFEDGSCCNRIGSSAFLYSTSLRTVTIPEMVETIGSNAFNECYKLVEVCNLSTLDIVAGSTSNGYVGYYATRIYTDADEPSYVSTTDTGFVFYDDGDSSYLIDYNGKGLSLVLPTFEDGRTYGIWRYAFYNRKEFEIVTIPEYVTSIGTYAFYGCTSISEIYFNAESVNDLSSSNYVFGNAGQYGDGITVTIGAGVTSIPAYLFCPYSSSTSYVPKITSVIFEDGSRCTSVGNYAFYYCTSITGVYISDIYTWSEINFGNSYANPLYYSGDLYVDGVLTTLLPNDLTSIGTYAFSGWTVTSLTIPGSVTSVGGNAFSFCLSLETLTINEGVVTIGNSAFSGCTSLQSVTIGKSVTSIGNSAFSGCTSLQTVTVGGGITTIGNYAFSDCTSIKSVYAADLDSWCNISFGNSTSSPLWNGGDLYFGNNLVTDLNFSADLTSIGQYAFSGCTSLKSVTIPESVTSIGTYAFANCENLISITIPESVTTIGSYAFYYCTALEEIYFNAVSMEDLSSSNYVFYRAGQSGTGMTVMIGKYVTKIPAYIFYPYSSSSSNVPKITSLNFEEGSKCTSIGSYAFEYCEYLTSITIPASVTSIGKDAFYDCTGISEIYFDAESMDDLSSYNYVFENAGRYSSGTTLTIGKDVTKIPAYLFCPCSSSSYCPRITTVIFEKDSKCSSIGSYAFYYCSYITKVYYSGTTEEWSAISISSSGNSNLTSATRYYYSEEEPSEDGNYWHYVNGEIVVWKKES